MTANASLIDVRLLRIRLAAEDMKLYEFGRADGSALPAAEPGAHIDVHLPNGLVRQYSLVNTGHAPRTYVIGVKLEANGKGGSRWLHNEAAEGMALRLGGPRNHFPLNPKASHSILIAGGIGITPIYNMVRHIEAGGQSWELHYGCRSRAYCAFYKELSAFGSKVNFYFDDELGPGAIQFKALAEKAAASSYTDLYCCGPQGMLSAYEHGCAALPPGRAHLEHFSAPALDISAAPINEFIVELVKSGKRITVPAGKTILDCLTAIGINVPYSCSQGVCGSCETRVLEGIPEHRDVVLSLEERASNKTMMVCCSGSLGSLLKLDL